MNQMSRTGCALLALSAGIAIGLIAAMLTLLSLRGAL